MKFYNLIVRGGGETYTLVSEESSGGEWTTRDDAEQVVEERDEFERKCGELCQAHGTLLIKFHDAARDAVRMAELVKKYTYYTDQEWVDAQAIIERYEGGKG